MLQSQGASLIELLISILLLSIILFTIDAEQIYSLKKSKAIYYFSVAHQQINLIAERMSLSKNNFSHSLNTWNEQNKYILPQGKGKITVNYPHYDFSIFWGKINKDNCHTDKIDKQGCLHVNL
jgi:Tfp pilus assembly protein PilV